ncbi:hypothetical protein MBLNU230_g6575t1 [Neophaeotheca triangularis]
MLEHIFPFKALRRYDWAVHFLHSNDNDYSPYLRQALNYTTLLTTYARAYLLPLITNLTQKPDLATIALLLVIFFISLKILNMLYQAVMFWVRLAWRIVFWGGAVLLGLWLYTRGPEGVMNDFGYWMEAWGREYKYWKDQEAGARMARGKQQPLGAGAGRGFW